MKPQFENILMSSMILWFDHTLVKKGEAFSNHVSNFYPITNIPITYDSHHFRLNNPENLTAENAAQSCLETWGKFKPLFHFSNGRDHALDKAHSDYVYDIHEELFSREVDIDYEFKLKDLTIKKYEQDYLGVLL